MQPTLKRALQALKAAKVILQEGVAQLPKVASRKTPPLDIGVGIESGPVMVGSFGPARRRVHTVMGEAVSVASRLEKLTAELGYPVLLGPKALAQCGAVESLHVVGQFVFFDANARQGRSVHHLHLFKTVGCLGGVLSMGLERHGAGQ